MDSVDSSGIKSDSSNKVINLQKYRDLKDMAQEKQITKPQEKVKIRYKYDPKITILAACDENGVIGINNKIPWKLKRDMGRFKDYTKNKPVLMGINTFESLSFILPERINIVLTHDLDRVKAVVEKFKILYPQKTVPPVIHFSSINDLRDNYGAVRDSYGKDYNLDELIIAGGKAVYEIFINLADKILLTWVSTKVKHEGNVVKFPTVNLTDAKHWKKIEEVGYFKDQENEFNFKFFTFERPKQAHVISFSGKCEISKLDRAADYERVEKRNGYDSKPTN